MKTVALAFVLIALAACERSAAPEHTPAPVRDKQALRIIERAGTAADRISHGRVEMQQVEITYLAPGQPPLSAIEEKRHAHHKRLPQPDGSVLLTDRVQGYYENLAPGLSWYAMTRAGADPHVDLAFADREWTFSFQTRFPESIARTPTSDVAKADGAPVLRWLARNMAEESREAHSVRLGGREIIQGVLCDVIELDLKPKADGSEAPPENRQTTYYVGVMDGLVYRHLDAQGASGRRSYRERLFAIDPAFIPKDISYARFESEVRKLLQGKPMPPVIAKMQ